MQLKKKNAEKTVVHGNSVGDEVINKNAPQIDLAAVDSEVAMAASVEKRRHTVAGKISLVMAFGMALFHIYTGFFGLFDFITQRGVHMAFALTILILNMPMVEKIGKGKLKKNKVATAICYAWDVIMIIAVWVAVFISKEEYVLRIDRAGAVTGWATLAGAILIIVVIECGRRSLGNIMPILAIIFLLYAYFGPYLPIQIAHKGYSITKICQFMATNMDGIFGQCLSVSATVIYMFILFGAFLEASGCSEWINKFAISLTGRMKAGPALSAVVASALMGCINGSAVANVVGTGTFTIPLMKQRGYEKNFAGAVESVASTGGQILPPVMGAGAFIMVQFTSIDYGTIARSAVIPALLYFLGCAFAVIFRAEVEKNVEAHGDTGNTRILKIVSNGILYLLIIAFLITMLMILGYSALKSALYSTCLVPLIMLLDVKQKRLNYKKIPMYMVKASENSTSIVAGCACAGIIVAVVAMTGIGVVFGDMMISLANGNTFLALVFSALACIVLGMGLPTTASYVIAASIIAPALTRLGIPILAAHLFVFYYACLSAITPPVALAAYAAAGISGGTPMKTAIEACKVGFAGFIIPFMFVYNSALMAVGTAGNVIWCAITGLVGVIAMSAGFQGWFFKKLNMVERIIILIGGFAMVVPEIYTDYIGLAVVAVFFVLKKLVKKNQASKA